jgi:hypothetical protein
MLSAVSRLDAEPAVVGYLVDDVRRALRAVSGRGKGTRQERALARGLVKELHALPVRLVAGKRLSLGKLLKDLEAAVPPKLLDALEADAFWRMEPFNMLGNVPVGTGDDASGTRLAQVFPVFGRSAQGKVPVRSGARRSHTLWMHYSKSWWSAVLYTKYSASTWTTATGWDACDILGGDYLAAKHACETLVVPPPGDPSQFIIAFLKTAACTYAGNAPEVPFPSLMIRTIACSCDEAGSGQGCSPYITEPGHDPTLSSYCAQAERTNTAGPVDASTSQWGGGCLGATSFHVVEFLPGVIAAEDFC